MLLQDEQYVIHWLSQYGALTYKQVVLLLKDKSPETADKIIRNLKKKLIIFDIADGYYLGLDNICEPDQKIISAVWVLLSFYNQVLPMEHYPASYPAQLFFLKNNIGYEIIVLYDGETHLTRLLQPQEDLRYIVVIPNISMVKELILPNVPCLFVTLNFTKFEEPTVNFYKEGRDI